MKFPMTVELEKPDDKTETLTFIADARDLRIYEGEFGVSFITTELSMTQISQLAFVAARRLGKFKGSWDAFDAAAIEVELDTSNDEGPVEPADPTPSAPARKRSSP